MVMILRVSEISCRAFVLPPAAAGRSERPIAATDVVASTPRRRFDMWKLPVSDGFTGTMRKDHP
jgi:hypothetical protein